jgi:hypothetical protein
MATDNLSDTDDRVRKLLDAKFDPPTRQLAACVLTGKRTFGDALASALNSEEVARELVSVDVWRRDLRAALYFKRGRRRHIELSQFGRQYYQALEVQATLSGGVIARLARELRNENAQPIAQRSEE